MFPADLLDRPHVILLYLSFDAGCSCIPVWGWQYNNDILSIDLKYMSSTATHNNVFCQGLNIIKSAEIIHWMLLNFHTVTLWTLGVHKIMVVNNSHGFILITQSFSFLSPKGFVKLYMGMSSINFKENFQVSWHLLQQEMWYSSPNLQ